MGRGGGHFCIGTGLSTKVVMNLQPLALAAFSSPTGTTIDKGSFWFCNGRDDGYCLWGEETP